MERDHSECIRGYVRFGQTWFAEREYDGENALDEFCIGMYSSPGGTSGEFCIRWVKLQGSWHMQLAVYSDACSALSLFHDLLAELAERDSENPSPDEIEQILQSLGIHDITERDRSKRHVDLVARILENE